MATTEAPMTPAGVRAWRGRKKWTQKYAAKMVGVAPRSWRRWENGERDAPIMLGRWMRAIDLIISKGLRPDEPYISPRPPQGAAK